MLGQAHDLKVEVNGERIKTSPLVAIDHPRDYMILGEDSIIKNRSQLSKLIAERIMGDKNNRADHQTINQICKDTLLDKYDDKFATEVDMSRACNVTEHRIFTEDCQPICLPGIQIPKYWEEEIDAEIKKLLKIGVIRHSNSPWGARIVPVKRKVEK